MESRCWAHLHRRVGLRAGGEHLRRARPQARLRALQQPQQRGQAANHRQVCTASQTHKPLTALTRHKLSTHVHLLQCTGQGHSSNYMHHLASAEPPAPALPAVALKSL